MCNLYLLLLLYHCNLGELYICGCGGSDTVEGDRLRKNGDCADAAMIEADPLRVAAAVASLHNMSSIITSATTQLDITQVY